jgi:hypothetical protein
MNQVVFGYPRRAQGELEARKMLLVATDAFRQEYSSGDCWHSSRSPQPMASKIEAK